MIDVKIFFPERCFSDGMIEEIMRRYVDPETGWATCHWDDTAHTRRRKASIDEGSIAPEAVYEPPLSHDELPNGRTPVGRTIECGWHPQLIADITRDPQPEPELFAGVRIVEHSES